MPISATGKSASAILVRVLTSGSNIEGLATVQERWKIVSACGPWFWPDCPLDRENRDEMFGSRQSFSQDVVFDDNESVYSIKKEQGNNPI